MNHESTVHLLILTIIELQDSTSTLLRQSPPSPDGYSFVSRVFYQFQLTRNSHASSKLILCLEHAPRDNEWVGVPAIRVFVDGRCSAAVSQVSFFWP